MPGLVRHGTIDEPRRRRSPDAAIVNPSHRFDRKDWPQPGESPPPFPITRHGYDRASVDRRVAELEQELIELDHELADLQDSSLPKNDADSEIGRLGEQVSAILITAHESAAEITRRAEAEAACRIADAESRARSLAEDANREVRDLQRELASLRQERERLLDDIRNIADALRAVADKPAKSRQQSL